MPIGEDELQLHLRIPRETFRDDLAEQSLGERHRRRHAQSPGGNLGARRQRAPGLPDRLERRTTRPEVGLTRARELHVACRSVKEARAEGALELDDPAAHRRARHAQRISSCPKAPKLGDLHEELDGTNLDHPVHGTEYPTGGNPLHQLSLLSQMKGLGSWVRSSPS